MTSTKKVIESVLSGQKDNNIRFSDFQKLIKSLGFKERISGDHFVYKHPDYPERIVIQPDGNKAKAYQVKQVRQLINKYDLKEVK